jgi:TPR repeat protein
MRRSICIALVAATLAFGGMKMASAGSFEDGVAAHKRGDYFMALHLWETPARQGHPGAQLELGNMYSNWGPSWGTGIPRNYAEAAKWYGLAAKQGNAKAQNNLGEMYYQGEGVSKDDAEAVKWFRLAAEQGYSEAQHNLGSMYNAGKGVPRNYAEARKWYRLAAEQGHPDAQYKLGVLILSGSWPTNYAEAVKWYRLAAEQGDFGAQFRLGYEEGFFRLLDPTEAVKWFRLSAERGYPDAQNNLGVSYEQGKGVPQDYVSAHMWFNLAGAGGLEIASTNRDRIASKMTPAQIAEAQRLAASWEPKKRHR